MTWPSSASPAQPQRWDDAAAQAYRDALVRAHAAGSTHRSSLARDAARAAEQWHGPTRTDFDERTARLVGALRDLDQHLSASLAWLDRRRREVAVPTSGALGPIPPVTPLAASPSPSGQRSPGRR